MFFISLVPGQTVHCLNFFLYSYVWCQGIYVYQLCSIFPYITFSYIIYLTLAAVNNHSLMYLMLSFLSELIRQNQSSCPPSWGPSCDRNWFTFYWQMLVTGCIMAVDCYLENKFLPFHSLSWSKMCLGGIADTATLVWEFHTPPSPATLQLTWTCINKKQFIYVTNKNSIARNNTNINSFIDCIVTEAISAVNLTNANH